MGGICSMHAEKKSKFGFGNLKERDRLEGLDVDGRIMLK